MAVVQASVHAAYLTSNEAAISAHFAKQVRSFAPHTVQLGRFLAEFTCSNTNKKYLNQLQQISNNKSTVLKIALDDVREFFMPQQDLPYKNPEELDPGLPAALEKNSLRYIRLLYDAAEDIKNRLAPPNGDYNHAGQERGMGKLEVMEAAKVPVYLRAPYEVHLIPPSDMKALSVREVRSFHMGSLVKVDAIVTKVSSVKPRLQVAYYKCLDCGADAHQPIEGSSYMPLSFCQSQACSVNQKKGELRMMLPESKFVKYQEVRVQEPSNQVPPGSIPRSQKMIVDGSLTRILLPGMMVTLAGIPTPMAKVGFQALRAGLLTETTFLVNDIEIHKKGYHGDLGEIEDEEVHKVLRKYQNDPHLYEKMARSLAPSIHGLEDVKKALLLQLVGGTSENIEGGMKLRGDIHVLLMGDPGVAKSQLLCQVCRIAQRAHYTTGKGSSGVGLTAMVVRDPITGDFTLEGGAIVLSDKGICCIDEFDKMDEYDRTSIHEVMEQQTVSISKAGLTTTLNARTSILAAANPQYGRYDIKKSPVQNINLPAALLSRFDVQFLLLDRADREQDLELARHVLKVHQQAAEGSTPVEETQEFLDGRTIRILIEKAKTYQPKMPSHISQEIVDYYVDLRQREKGSRGRSEFASYTTPRTLMAILRLTQALARLRFSASVDRGDFEEALRLVSESQRSILSVTEENKGRKVADYQSEVIEMLKEMDNKHARRVDWNGWLSLIDVQEAAARNGFERPLLLKALEVYEELDILQLKNSTHVAFTERLNQRS